MKSWKIYLGLLMALVTQQVFATCSYLGPTTALFTTGNLVIPSSLAVGATITTSFTTNLWGQFSCTGPVYVVPSGYFALSTPLRLAPGYSDVWATGYPGIGVRFHLLQGGTLSSTKSPDVALGYTGWNGGQRFLLYTNLASNFPTAVELVKTGTIATGVVSRVQIASDLATNVLYSISAGSGFVTLVSGTHVPISSIWLQSFNVTAATPTCSLSTSSATFNMGNVLTTAFTGGAGSHQPWVANQSLVSGGCNASTVSMTFAGTAAAAPYSNAFANAGTARGVALELWQANGKQAIPNSSTPIDFAPQASGGRYTFSARYIQTAATVTPGSVNATVTVTVDYK